jgi:hypothetical protein
LTWRILPRLDRKRSGHDVNQMVGVLLAAGFALAPLAAEMR